MPATAATVHHHHRNTTKIRHKPYKPRFASKNALKDKAKGKIEGLERGVRKTPHQQVMSKLDRRNRAKQMRLNNHAAHTKATNVFAGKDGAHRIVAVVPLAGSVSAADAIASLNASLDIDDSVSRRGSTKIRVERFKQRLQYVSLERDLFAILDGCKLADYVILLLSPQEEVDEYSLTILRCIESQGISNVYTMVQGIEKVEPQKKRVQVQVSLKNFITRFFPTQEKVFSTDSPQECQNLARSLCTTTPAGIRWREDRTWMMVEDVRWPELASAGQSDGEAILTGTVRGANLKADRLLQIGDWGSFQIEKIVIEQLQGKKKEENNAMALEVDGAQQVQMPSIDREGLEELAPEEAVMDDMNDRATSIAPSEGKGVLLDDQRYYSEDESDQEEARIKRLPRGTSKYQSAWYLGDMSDSGSDMEDVKDEDESGIQATPADGIEGLVQVPEPTELGESEYPQSEMFVDPNPDDDAEALADYRAKRKKTEAEDEREFPDEIELPPNALARERFARYRGLKSLRTSPWNQEEDHLHQPDGWARLLEISDYKGAKNRVLNEGLVGGIKAGARVQIHVRNVPRSFETTYDPQYPLAAFSLLRHEQKRTAVNCSITLDSDFPKSIKSKEELIIQCGPRRFVINPLFSQSGTTPNDVHKFERYLHPGRLAIASFTAPLTWGPVPILFFKRSSDAPSLIHVSNGHSNGNMATEVEMTDIPAPSSSSTGDSGLTLIGKGTNLPASTNRIIAKRIVLTGQPFKIHRKVVTVRYMFFNMEDVAWFRALPLWTNRGRQGSIKESLGTHGYFKAVFDGKIGMQDAVGVSLYKRVWPRPGRLFRPGIDI